VQKVADFVPHPFTALGWSVADMGKTIADLTARGVRLERYDFVPQDPDGIWTTPDGAKVAWFKDPDGNTLSITEPSPTAVG
jgi:predicted enzyme related to lactoylglutathione lyase